MSRILNAEDILGADDLKNELVEVPEWGGSVYVKAMSGAERDDYEKTQYLRISESAPGGKPTAKQIAESLKNATAELVACTACDAEGNLLFTAEQAAELGRKSASALKRVAEVAQRLNGIGEAEQDRLKKA